MLVVSFLSVKMPSCDVCNRCFTKARNLKRHNKEQHFNSKLFLCSVKNCAKTFKRRSNFTQHLEKKHHYDKSESRQTTIKAKPKPRNLLTSGVYSDISDVYSDVSSDDEILDLVKELDEYLDSYVPVEVTDSFIDDLLEETGNSTGDVIMLAPPQRRQRRRRRLILPKLLYRLCKSQLRHQASPRNLIRLITRSFLF